VLADFTRWERGMVYLLDDNDGDLAACLDADGGHEDVGMDRTIPVPVNASTA